MRRRNADPVVGVVVVFPTLHVGKLGWRQTAVISALVQLRHVAAAGAGRILQSAEDCVSQSICDDRIGKRVCAANIFNPPGVARSSGGWDRHRSCKTWSWERGNQTAVDHRLKQSIEQRDDALLVWRKLRRRDNHPRASYCRRGVVSTQLDGRGYWSVRDIVVPVVIYPKVANAGAEG